MKPGAKFKAALVGLLSIFGATGFAGTNTIQVFNFDYGTPPSTHTDPTINLGDTVTWVWAAPNHSTTAAAGQMESWNSGVHNMPFSYSHTFTELGTFTYYCSVHGVDTGCGHSGAMSGKVIVVQPGVSAYRITAITPQGNDIRISWITGGICKTNALQRATGTADGSFTNAYVEIFTITNTLGLATNYVDVGAGTNFPARYYRVRVVP